MAARLRFWRSFSLRTLLVVVTLLCCYLGWQVNVVRQRKVKLQEFQTRYYIEVTKAADYAARSSAAGPPKDLARVSWLRHWLGDEAVQRIDYYPHVVKEAELAQIRRWFPEAQYSQTQPLEPCHPGCFPWGTLIETAKGPLPVEQIEVGDLVIAILRSGKKRRIAVESIFRTRNRLIQVETTAGALLTTPTQPLYVTSSKNIAAGELQKGDSILVWKEGKLSPAQVNRILLTERIEPVINLVLGDSEAFIANGFVARSKPPADSPLAGAEGAPDSHALHGH